MNNFFMATPDNLTEAMERGQRFFEEGDEQRAHVLAGNCLLYGTETKSAEFLKWQTYVLIGHALNMRMQTEEEVDAALQDDLPAIVGKMIMSGDTKYSEWLEITRMLNHKQNLSKGGSALWGEQE
ncbi:MAG: hypothetical protein GW762_04390 [Candidatus Pacebacteria bacterium]|nr:hypothetical protein [Candidatus Paceibacterota bacterium]PIR63385.1 MAG: hypothetical protein COU64_04900 [Candidatus Pacebacteria bacterium CG10_big_fil_rev_8_21_14_0_10_40_26]PJA69179.1 MAG: hypothetical protein CO156_01070 [Candidatus Pacebacteria bacterium CG_4_9_14_3_um_filter_40_12]